MTDDKFYVYRPLLDLIGRSEGTDKGDGYNETLAYGAYTGGDVDLVSMTLSKVDALQTRMLQHPDNKWNSSAAGRYQIVRTTLRAIRKTLALPGTVLFDRATQDRMACYLLGVRGIDKWLAGRMKLDTLLNNLASEWASLPMPNGNGKYGGQHAAVSVADVKVALDKVRARHASGQPVREVAVPVPKPVVPESVDKAVQKTAKQGGWLSVIGGALGTGVSAVLGADWQTVAVIGGVGLGIALLALAAGPLIVSRIKAIRQAVEGTA